MKTWLVALIAFTAVMVIGFSCGREEKKIIDPPKVLTDHENQVAARDLLNKKPQSPADIGQIAKHLNAISTKAPEYKEVPALLKKTAVEEKRLIKETAERLRIKGIKDREEYIDLLEKVYLKQGMDVHLTASGRDKKVLTFKYIFVSRPFVYQMSTSSDVINNLKNLGFEKVIFTDGYNSSWSMDVK